MLYIWENTGLMLVQASEQCCRGMRRIVCKAGVDCCFCHCCRMMMTHPVDLGLSILRKLTVLKQQCQL